MKKAFILSLFLLIISYIQADTLRNFVIQLGGPSPMTAGNPVQITITAWDITNAVKTDYNGPCALTATTGQAYIQETGSSTIPDGTHPFVNGVWRGVVQLRGAENPLTLTCVDPSGATGTVTKITTVGAYSKLKVITQGMTFTPGTEFGSDGAPDMLTTQTPFSVTVVACDNWYNQIQTGFPRVRISSGAPLACTPTTIDMSISGAGNTLFAASVWPSPDQAIVAPVWASDIDNGAIACTYQNVSFTSLNNFYLWAGAPVSAFVGQDFSVTVQMSHYITVSTTPGTPVLSFNKLVNITAIDENGNTKNPISPGLLPAPSSQAMVNGVTNFTVHHNKREKIRVLALYKDTPFIYPYQLLNADTAYSNLIEFTSEVPDSFTTTISGQKLGKSETGTVTASVLDQFANAVSGTAINFYVMSGMGSFSEAGGRYVTVTTDWYGNGYAHFSASDNTKATLGISVPGVAAPQVITVEVGRIIHREQISNYPNPFNPLREATTIEYYLDVDAEVELKLYSVAGALAWSKTIPKSSSPGGVQGYNAVPWDGMSDRGMAIGVGLYILKVNVNTGSEKYTLTRKIAVKK